MLQNCNKELKIIEDNLRQTEEEKKIQKEEIEPIEKMIKTKILGILLLFFTIFWTYLGIYDFITFGLGLTIIHVTLYVFSYIVGIALIMIKKGGTYHKLLLISGIILIVIFILWTVMIILAISFL